MRPEPPTLDRRDNRHTRLPVALGVAGVLPMAAAAVLAWTGSAREAAAALQAITTYAAVVLGFLGGIQWGTGVAVHAAAPQSARTLFLLSIVPALLAWGMLFIDSTGARLMVAMFLFAFVWLIDALLYLQQLIPAWFFRLRSVVTPLVLLCLLAALARQ